MSEKLEFTLDDENLVFGYLDNVEIHLYDVIDSIYLARLVSLKDALEKKQIENLMDQYNDLIFSEFRNFVECRADEFEEIEDATGLWGHYSFVIVDQTKEQGEAIEELKKIIFSNFVSVDDLSELG